jgi:glycosyltransferase involved in cell wall biosynthesis
MKLSIVIPDYNESATICEVVKRVGEVNGDKEVIIVDDCSTDGTRILLEKYEKREGFEIIYQTKNRGKGAALRAGFKIAKGGIVIIQDADLEYNPKDYPCATGAYSR